MKQSWVTLEEVANWQALLSHCPHSAYHTHQFCTALQLAHGHSIRLYHASLDSERIHIVAPMAFKTIDAKRLVYSPYGYAGFTGTCQISEDDFQAAFVDFMQTQGYITGYFTLHALFHPFVPSKMMTPTITYPALSSYCVNLSQDIDNLYRALSNNHKRQLKKWATREATLVLDQAELQQAFLKLYPTFMSQKKAATVYDFGEAALAEIFASVPCYLIGVREQDNLVAVSVFIYTEHIADFFLHAACEGAHMYARKIMWEAICYFKEKQIPYLHLGGGISEDDGLANYKKQFAAKKYTNHCWKLIFNEATYQALCQQYQVSTSRDGYFPAFCQPGCHQ